MSDVSRVEPRRQFDAVPDGRDSKAFNLTDFANNLFRDFRRLRQLALLSFRKSIGGRAVLALDVDNLDDGPQSHRCQIV
jgi:hypothetical protein